MFDGALFDEVLSAVLWLEVDGVGEGVAAGALSAGRCSVGRSSLVLDGLGVGVTEGDGVPDGALSAGRWRVGRSSEEPDGAELGVFDGAGELESVDGALSL